MPPVQTEARPAARSGERDGDQNDLATSRLDAVADGFSVLLCHLRFARLDAAGEGRLGDVVGGIAEGALGRDVLAEKTPVVRICRLGSERGRKGDIDGGRLYRALVDCQGVREVARLRRTRGAPLFV